MSFNQFKEFVFENPKGLYYHFFKHGLVINAPVNSIEPYYETGISVDFEGGHLHVWETNKVQQVHRPANLITQCEACFSLSNEYGDHVGYIYKLTKGK